MPADFALVTEVAGSQATREQIEMIHARYSEAARLAPGRRVLEVASGPGRGLGLIARSARSIVGGDCTFSLLQQGAAHYRGRLPFVQLDAEALPFRDASFDLIVMFEAIYYLDDAGRFLRECRRTLAPGGVLLLSSANCEAPGFTSSAFVTRVYPARELAVMMETHGFQTRLMAGFEVHASGVRARVASAVAEVLARLDRHPPFTPIALASSFTTTVGDQRYLRERAGLSASATVRTIAALLGLKE